MKKQKFDVNRLRVASPCKTGWETMSGDERTRFCRSCSLNVYNISEMTNAQVESLVKKTEGRFCGRIYRRADGTVLTKNCPVGLRAYYKRTARLAGAALGAMLGLFSISFGQTEDKNSIDASKTKIVKTYAQPDGSILTGKISDETRAVIPGAEITLTAKDKSEIKVKTNDDGVYIIRELVPGVYNLKVETVGFEKLEVINIEIKDKKLTALDLRLESGPVTIGVMSSPEIVEILPAGVDFSSLLKIDPEPIKKKP
ncbi:MAG TPA: carboxypeptidase-like regulatory domain-containing protein [Pyrinomonadaceae bacterium]|jgi:hypothetical protein